jgi:hypothetical protein
VPLAEIREQVSGLSRDEIRGLLAEEDRQAGRERRAAERQSARDYITAMLERRRSGGSRTEPPAPAIRASAPLQEPFALARMAEPEPERGEAWRRYALAPGVELQVRADLADEYEDLIRELQAVARAAGRRRRR